MITIETLMAEDLDLGTGPTEKTHQLGGVVQGYQISLSTLSLAGAKGVAVSTTWDPGSIAAGSSEEKEVTVQGAALGDFVLASFSLDVQGLIMSANVTADNTVTIVLGNLTASSVDLGSGTIRILVFKTR